MGVQKKKRVVIASTSDVYGYGTSLPFVETDPVSLGPLIQGVGLMQQQNNFLSNLLLVMQWTD